jgi:hypothetical protein
MSDIKQAVANARRNRTGGAGTFVSGDVTEGTVREAEVKEEDPKVEIVESDTDKQDE